jgi:hypothetical protein
MNDKFSAFTSSDVRNRRSRLEDFLLTLVTKPAQRAKNYCITPEVSIRENLITNQRAFPPGLAREDQ